MKFNIPKNGAVQVKNYEGAKAFALNPGMQLYSAIVTWSLNDFFTKKTMLA